MNMQAVLLWHLKIWKCPFSNVNISRLRNLALIKFLLVPKFQIFTEKLMRTETFTGKLLVFWIRSCSWCHIKFFQHDFGMFRYDICLGLSAIITRPIFVFSSSFSSFPDFQRNRIIKIGRKRAAGTEVSCPFIKSAHISYSHFSFPSFGKTKLLAFKGLQSR